MLRNEANVFRTDLNGLADELACFGHGLFARGNGKAVQRDRRRKDNLPRHNRRQDMRCRRKVDGEFLNAAVSFPDRGGLIHDVHETLACTRLKQKTSCSGMRQVSEAGKRSLPAFFKRGEVPDWFYAKNMPKKGEQVACLQEQDLSKPLSVAVNERAVLEMKHSETVMLESGSERPSVDEIIRTLRKAGNLPPCLYRM